MSGVAMQFHGVLNNLKDIKSYLFEDNHVPISEEPKEEMDFGWGEDDTVRDETLTQKFIEEVKEKQSDWISNCKIAYSPVGDFFVIGRNKKIIYLSGEWDEKRGLWNLVVSYKGEISTSEKTDFITSVICIPILSQKKSSHGAPDWTCVAVGFNSGTVNLYTEAGSLLLSQMFHNEPVNAFKCHSFYSAKSSLEHDQLEELTILYPTVIVILDGFGLFQTLRACRSQLARSQARFESAVDAPPLSYKKWNFDKQEKTVDCETLGTITPCLLDHFLTASIHGGFTAHVKAIPLTSTVFLTAGQKPYMSYLTAQEGIAFPVFVEIAYAVASKLKNSLMNAASGWLGFGSSSSKAKEPTAEKAKIEQPNSTGLRFGLPDASRIGLSIIVSPCRRLSAITDSLGRIIIIDNQRGIAIRILKGYRDSEIAWIDTAEDVGKRSKSQSRRALFLLVFAPRKGTIEIFAMEQGPKVGSFTASRSGRLLSTNFGFLGLSNFPMRGGNRPQVPALYMNHEGEVYSFDIPFHLALSDGTSVKVKDMHLLKSIQRVLRDEPESMEQILFNLLKDLKSQSLINQGFKILTRKVKDSKMFKSLIEDYIIMFSDQGEKDLSLAFELQSLLDLYQFLSNSLSDPPPYSEDPFGNREAFLLGLQMTEGEKKTLDAFEDKYFSEEKEKKRNVSFEEEQGDLPLTHFFASFVLDQEIGKRKVNGIPMNMKAETIRHFGKFFYCGLLNGTSDLESWKTHVKGSGLLPSQILLLLFNYWTEMNFTKENILLRIERLYKVLFALCELQGFEVVCSEINASSKWWEEVRRDITKSPNIFHNYTFSLVSRGVVANVLTLIESKKKKRESKESVEESEDSEGREVGWENLSFDSLKWNSLLKQIEDLWLLSKILVQRPEIPNTTIPLLPYENEQLSVASLLDKGKGCIAELVGKWLTTIGLEPQLIGNLEPVKKVIVRKGRGKLEQELTPSPEPQLDEKTQLALDLVKNLLENFSVSLTVDTILANYAWEFCLEWNKDINSLSYLESSVRIIKCIKCPLTKQGMMSMIWSTFISKPFAHLTGIPIGKREKLVEKVQQAPLMGGDEKEKFLEITFTFLDSFMESKNECEGIPSEGKKMKRNHWANEASSTSLTDLALVQPTNNYQMILLHYQLALVTLFVQIFNLKRANMRPNNLFDTRSRGLFFESLSLSPQQLNVEVDLSLKLMREEFLCHVVSNAAHAIPQECDDSNKKSELNSMPTLEGLQENEKIIQRCFELGKIWSIDLDGLRINQVCEYYSNGFDILGLQTIGSVSGRDLLGSKLLVIAGMRLNFILKRNKSNIELISTLSTNLTNWLKNLNYSQLRCLRFSKESIIDLTEQVMHLIPESNYDYKLALELHSSLALLIA